MTISSMVSNFFNAINMYYPVSYLVRDIFESNNNYENACSRLQTSFLISPVYYIICPFELSLKPLIIQRSSANNIVKIIESETVIQTNADSDATPDINIMWSFERYKMVNQILSFKNNNN